MIRSMTGYGAARRDGLGVSASVEVKSINGRFFKLALKAPSSLSAREHELEALVKTQVRRGSVTLKADLREQRDEALVSVDENVVRAYQTVFRRLGISEEPLATLPGVLASRNEELDEKAWGIVCAAAGEALEQLVSMRRREGEALAAALGAACSEIEALARSLRARVPAVAVEYRDKLHKRLTGLLEGFGAAIDAQLVAREVALFADRCDVTEELDRLASHLVQARGLIAGGDEAGRTLDFLSQEMLREANTIGAKSADAELSRLVVQLKVEIERFREQAANVE